MLILHYNYFNVWVYRTRVAHCTFEITLLQTIMLTLLLVCSFSSTQVQKYLAWVLYCGVPSGRCVAHCAFEITLSGAIMLTLLLVCSFSPKVQSIFWGPRICDIAISHCDKSLFCDVLSDIFLFRENCIKNVLVSLYKKISDTRRTLHF